MKPDPNTFTLTFPELPLACTLVGSINAGLGFITGDFWGIVVVIVVLVVCIVVDAS